MSVELSHLQAAADRVSVAGSMVVVVVSWQAAAAVVVFLEKSIGSLCSESSASTVASRRTLRSSVTASSLLFASRDDSTPPLYTAHSGQSGKSEARELHFQRGEASHEGRVHQMLMRVNILCHFAILFSLYSCFC